MNKHALWPDHTWKERKRLIANDLGCVGCALVREIDALRAQRDDLLDLLATALVLVECWEDEFGNRDVKLIADTRAAIAKAKPEGRP